MDRNHLGAFLRARRAGLTPQDVDMASHGTRRVTGLRREEVAVLARALRLDGDARTHLFRLAGSSPGTPRTLHTAAAVSPALRQLMDGYPHTPAFVLGRSLDILATNTLADALFTPFDPADNLARMIFLYPAGRHFYTDWERPAQAALANLHESAGLDPDSPRLHRLVTEL